MSGSSGHRGLRTCAGLTCADGPQHRVRGMLDHCCWPGQKGGLRVEYRTGACSQIRFWARHSEERQVVSALAGRLGDDNAGAAQQGDRAAAATPRNAGGLNAPAPRNFDWARVDQSLAGRRLIPGLQRAEVIRQKGRSRLMDDVGFSGRALKLSRMTCTQSIVMPSPGRAHAQVALREDAGPRQAICLRVSKSLQINNVSKLLHC